MDERKKPLGHYSQNSVSSTLDTEAHACHECSSLLERVMSAVSLRFVPRPLRVRAFLVSAATSSMYSRLDINDGNVVGTFKHTRVSHHDLCPYFHQFSTGGDLLPPSVSAATGPPVRRPLWTWSLQCILFFPNIWAIQPRSACIHCRQQRHHPLAQHHSDRSWR